MSEADTQLLRIVLPDDNIFSLPVGTRGSSVGHGWVILLHPLNLGTHTIVIRNGTQTIVTTIIVVSCGRAPQRLVG